MCDNSKQCYKQNSEFLQGYKAIRKRNHSGFSLFTILVPRATVSFGRVVSETEGSSRQRHFKETSTGD